VQKSVRVAEISTKVTWVTFLYSFFRAVERLIFIA